jgi:hypothetical protein
MKCFWLSSVFMAGLIVSGGNAFAENGYPSPGPANSRILLADASLDLDVTMEVVDEDVQSSAAITNVIELPVQVRNRYREMRQEQLGNGPGAVDGQENGAMPAESRPDSGPDVSRPTEAPGPGSPDIKPEPPQEPNRPESPAPDITPQRPDVPVAPRGPEKDKAPQMKNDPIMNKGGK